MRDVVCKYHASCYGTQAPITAALQIGSLHQQSVSAINVYIEPQYMTVCNIQTRATEAEAKFSVRHTVALAMAGKDTAANAAFEPAALGDPYFRAWSEHIKITSAPGLCGANASVEVRLSSAQQTVIIFEL